MLTGENMQKEFTWTNISPTKAKTTLELYEKESTVLDWEITPLKKGFVDLTIVVEHPDKK